MKRTNKKMKNGITYNEKGITLIALVVTIIVLIILASVSINLVLGDNGIIEKAKYARDITEQSKLNEEIATNELIKELGYIVDGETTIYDLKAGDYIKYDTGVASVGKNGVITCRVLYEASSAYGLQIISNKNIGPDITLGGDNLDDAKESYNNAIAMLNSQAENYLNTDYAVDARCVGSMPNINENGQLINKNSETTKTIRKTVAQNVDLDTGCKDSDQNYITDYNTMNTIGIRDTGENYWLASRMKERDYPTLTKYSLDVRNQNLTSGYALYTISYHQYIGDSCNAKSLGLRPCFSLKSDIKITGGDGKSEATAYTM